MRISDWSSDVCSSDLETIVGACRVPRAPTPEQTPALHPTFPDKREARRSGIQSKRTAAGTSFRRRGDGFGSWPLRPGSPPPSDRTSVVYGKGVSVRVDPGGRRILKKKKY